MKLDFLNAVPLIKHVYSLTGEAREAFHCNFIDFGIWKDAAKNTSYFLLALGKEEGVCSGIISLSLEEAIELRDCLSRWIDMQQQK